MSAADPGASDRLLVSRKEAARMCGVSLGSFDAHVREHVVTKVIGRRVLVDVQSVTTWASTKRVAAVEEAERRTTRVPRVLTSGLSARAREIRTKLEARVSKSER